MIEIRQVFYPSGQLKCVSEYLDGKLHGTQRTWDINGQIMLERYFSNGIQQGNKGFYENGIKKFERNFYGLNQSWKLDKMRYEISRIKQNANGHKIKFNYDDDNLT